MEMKVRLLDGAEEKGVAQIEEELLAKHEESLSTDNNFEPQEQEQRGLAPREDVRGRDDLQRSSELELGHLQGLKSSGSICQ